MGPRLDSQGREEDFPFPVDEDDLSLRVAMRVGALPVVDENGERRKLCRAVKSRTLDESAEEPRTLPCFWEPTGPFLSSRA